jgi:hypothetical protein
MTVKLNHYWTIIPPKKNAYSRFIVKKFIPGVNRLGLHAVAGWSMLVGAYSEIIIETVASDLDLLENALRSKEYRELKSNLLNFVKNYKTKVLVPTQKEPAYTMDIAEDTVKFNQVWDVITVQQDDYRQYARYVEEEFYPVLEKIGIHVAGEWEVLIGDGPRIICEGRVTDVASLIPQLQGAEFRRAKQKLKAYVENYRSRILSFHVQKLKGYKSASYNTRKD